MRTVTITDTMDGATFALDYVPSTQRPRTGLPGACAGGTKASRHAVGILAHHSTDGLTVPCLACGGTVGLGRGVTRDNGDILAAAEADRLAGDSARFSAPDGVPYVRATVGPVCPSHNGDADARAPYRATLDAHARRLLDHHARRIT